MEIVICHPGNYNVSYSINPWMHPKKDLAINRNARLQWQKLAQVLFNLGVKIHEMFDYPELPDMCFVANAGLVNRNKIILSNFKYPERQPEKTHYKKWFSDHNFEILEIENAFYEGAGDSLGIGNKLFCGYGFRSDLSAYLSPKFNELGFEYMIPCLLVDPRFYHLDTCFCPLSEGEAIFFPDAFCDASREYIRTSFERTIEVPEQDALKFACNCVVVGKNVVLPSGCDATCQLLKDIGYEPFQVEMGEFLKAGGACKCLTLRVS